MNGVLGIAPLRSLVAVADCGGFQRAANTLHLSQGAVSQHVRRLEATVGRPLVERQGRGSSFTPDGERLLRQARLILEAHDETLRMFDAELSQSLVIGSTEHAADQLLSELRRELIDAMPESELRFRVDRGAQLREDLANGRIDLALLFRGGDDARAKPVGRLELTWYSAPGWTRPADGPVPLVAFDDPCAIRETALKTLTVHGVAADVACEAPHLAGVQAAVRAGLGVALMATCGRNPDGLVRVDDLPVAPPIELSLVSRAGLAEDLTDGVAAVVRGLAATGAPARELSFLHAA